MNGSHPIIVGSPIRGRNFVKTLLLQYKLVELLSIIEGVFFFHKLLLIILNGSYPETCTSAAELSKGIVFVPQTAVIVWQSFADDSGLGRLRDRYIKMRRL